MQPRSIAKLIATLVQDLSVDWSGLGWVNLHTTTNANAINSRENQIKEEAGVTQGFRKYLGISTKVHWRSWWGAPAGIIPASTPNIRMRRSEIPQECNFTPSRNPS